MNWFENVVFPSIVTTFSFFPNYVEQHLKIILHCFDELNHQVTLHNSFVVIRRHFYITLRCIIKCSTWLWIIALVFFLWTCFLGIRYFIPSIILGTFLISSNDFLYGVIVSGVTLIFWPWHRIIIIYTWW